MTNQPKINILISADAPDYASLIASLKSLCDKIERKIERSQSCNQETIADNDANLEFQVGQGERTTLAQLLACSHHNPISKIYYIEENTRLAWEIQMYDKQNKQVYLSCPGCEPKWIAEEELSSYICCIDI